MRLTVLYTLLFLTCSVTGASCDKRASSISDADENTPHPSRAYEETPSTQHPPIDSPPERVVSNDSDSATPPDSQTVWLERLQNSPFRQVKPVSSRSSSVRLVFKDGRSALFKPLQKGDHSARLEVAYFRIASMLDVQRVPVSVMRAVYPSRIETALQKEHEKIAADFMSTIERDEKGRVFGAMIEWLENLKPIGAENSKGKIDPAALLRDASFRPLHPALARMVMTDYLLSNWDRFSGGNLFRISESNQIALIDHNEAFYNLSQRQAEKLETALANMPCIDFALINKIRELTKEKIQTVVQSHEWKKSLLNDEEIENIMKRKTLLLRFIDERLASAQTDTLTSCDEFSRTQRF
ncbi:MAG: hypothetical protein JXX29_02165 [Deltaproteobacteria bacterium]|nr:hypothetical protein [Deltaproteobacteria bacterium]MBN2670447.1 hypothetical protein [Deltaproteobacteria bacterium]